MPTETKYRLIAPPIKQKKMSKNAYRMQILGMVAKTTRNIFFNILVLCIGMALGMGFTVLHIQRAWKDKLQPSELVKIVDTMLKYGIPTKDVQSALIQIQQQKMQQQEQQVEDGNH